MEKLPHWGGDLTSPCGGGTLGIAVKISKTTGDIQSHFITYPSLLEEGYYSVSVLKTKGGRARGGFSLTRSVILSMRVGGSSMPRAGILSPYGDRGICSRALGPVPGEAWDTRSFSRSRVLRGMNPITQTHKRSLRTPSDPTNDSQIPSWFTTPHCDTWQLSRAARYRASKAR